MSELSLLLVILVPAVFVLYVLARVATRDTDTSRKENISVMRNRYYFLESVGEELGDMLIGLVTLVKNLFGKKH